MAEGTGRRIKNILKSGSLKKWDKPDRSDDELLPEEIDEAEKDLDKFMGQATSVSENDWRELERRGRRMTGE